MRTVSPAPSMQEVAAAAETFGAVIIGAFPLTGSYDLEVPSSTEAQLLALAEEMIAAYPHIFRRVDVIYEWYFDYWQITTLDHPTNDPWWAERVRRGINPFRWPDTQWGLDAISAPAAWSYIGGNPATQVRVGIIDNGLMYYHEDLQIPRQNVVNYYTWSRPGVQPDVSHGTAVMGVIGAVHDNGLGLAGAGNFERSALFSYEMQAVSGRGTIENALIAALRWNVINGVRVINVSMAYRISYGGVRSMNLSEEMEALLNIGYCFVVVQASGNNANYTARNLSFFNHRGMGNDSQIAHLLNRTITVGATTRAGEVAHFSTPGSFVDILAPGDDIYTTTSFREPFLVPRALARITLFLVVQALPRRMFLPWRPCYGMQTLA